jgi:predicted DNA binding protein
MKHIRITVRPELDHAPPFLEYLLAAPGVREAHAVDWNRGATATSTHLYAVDGEVRPLTERGAETDGVESVRLSATDESVSYAQIELRDADVPIFGGAAEAVDREGLIIRRPMVYRDERIHGHVVGDADVLQATLDDLPETVGIQIDEIGQFPSARANPANTLSERQREALEVALELGYYETPRQTTHEEIAAELGCAPNTATEHLQKGEAKLVQSGLDAFSSSL